MRALEFANENFDDGKKPGRKGLAKRMGVNCKQSVSKLRKIAKNSTGERQRMAHWCANMKAGRSKANEQQLNELADKPYPFLMSQHGAEKSTFGFDTDSGDEYIVKIVPFKAGQGFQNDALDVSFALVKDGEYVDTATGQAGTDALRVFGTVLEAVKQTLAQRTKQGLNIDYLQFKSVMKEPKRVALYQRMAKNIGRYLPGWAYDRSWSDDGIATVLVKRAS